MAERELAAGRSRTKHCLTWPHPLIRGEGLVCLVINDLWKIGYLQSDCRTANRGILGLRDVTLSRNVQIQHGKNAFVVVSSPDPTPRKRREEGLVTFEGFSWLRGWIFTSGVTCKI